MEPQRFLTERAVEQITTLHRTQIARMVKAGRFPAPVYISARRKAWSQPLIAAWVDAMAAGRPWGDA